MGVVPGMMIRELDGVAYTKDLLQEKRIGDKEYRAVLERPKEQLLMPKPLKMKRD